jgi:peptidoglycan/xylan/chitin deacetylase (PgdA/CDA1 family)
MTKEVQLPIIDSGSSPLAGSAPEGILSQQISPGTGRGDQSPIVGIGETSVPSSHRAQDGQTHLSKPAIRKALQARLQFVADNVGTIFEAAQIQADPKAAVGDSGSNKGKSEPQPTRSVSRRAALRLGVVALKATPAVLVVAAASQLTADSADAARSTPVVPSKTPTPVPPAPSKTPIPLAKTPVPTPAVAGLSVSGAAENIIIFETSRDRINLLLQLTVEEQRKVLQDLLAKEGIQAVIDVSPGVIGVGQSIIDLRKWITDQMWTAREAGTPGMAKLTQKQREWCTKNKVNPETLANIMDAMPHIQKYVGFVPSLGMLVTLMGTETGQPAGINMGQHLSLVALKEWCEKKGQMANYEKFRQLMIGYITGLSAVTGIKYDYAKIQGSPAGSLGGAQIALFNLDNGVVFQPGANIFKTYGPQADSWVMAVIFLQKTGYKNGMPIQLDGKGNVIKEVAGSLYENLYHGWHEDDGQIQIVCKAENEWRKLPSEDQKPHYNPAKADTSTPVVVQALPVQTPVQSIQEGTPVLQKELNLTQSDISFLTSHEISGGDTGKSGVSITFDGGADGSRWPKLKEILGKNGVRITIFLTGDFIKKYPDHVREMVNMGLEIGNHSTTHPHMKSLTEAKFREEIITFQSRLDAACGRHIPVRFFRFPYGERDNTARTRLAKLGLQSVFWSSDGDSYGWSVGSAIGGKIVTSGLVLSRSLAALKKGNVNIMHIGSEADVAYLDEVLKEAVKRGLIVLPVSGVVKDSDIPPSIKAAGTKGSFFLTGYTYKQ